MHHDIPAVEIYGGISDWAHGVVRECQHLIACVELDAGATFPLDAAREFLSRLPQPRSWAEDRLLGSILFELSTRWAVRAHTQAHQGSVANCPFPTDTGICEAWCTPGIEAKRAFEMWAKVFFAALDASHLAPAPVRAARYICEHFATPLRVNQLAREVGMHSAGLRREFQRTYGMSLREYHVRARVGAALPLLSDSRNTVRMVAFAVGYANPKNFYRALKGVCRRTTAELRRLSPATSLSVTCLPAPSEQRGARGDGRAVMANKRRPAS